MAIPNVWIGNANATFHTFTITITGPATGDGTITIDIVDEDGTVVKTVSIDFTDTQTAAAIAANVQAALAASAIPEFLEYTYTYPGTLGVVTATGNQAGVPGQFSRTVTAAVGVTVTLADTVASTGPNQVQDAANWSLGKPDNTHELHVTGGPDMLYGLKGFAAWCTSQPTILRIFGAFGQGSCGLPPFRQAVGGGTYFEFRPRFFESGCATQIVGEGDGGGPGLANLQVPNSGTLRVIGTNGVVNITSKTGETPTLVNIFGGAVTYGYDTRGDIGCTITTVDVTGGTFSAAPNNTITNSIVRGGVMESFSANTNVTQTGGDYIQSGGSLGTLIQNHAGRAFLNHKQATTMVIQSTGVAETDAPSVDCSANDLPRVVSNTSFFKGGAFINDPHASCTFTTTVFDAESLAASSFGKALTISG